MIKSNSHDHTIHTIKTSKQHRQHESLHPLPAATPPPVPSPAQPPCRILVINSRLDAHYEILESVALRYPLPWEQDPRCQDPNTIVEVDIVCVSKKFNGVHTKNTEGWGYKNYFHQFLAGKEPRPRYVTKEPAQPQTKQRRKKQTQPPPQTNRDRYVDNHTVLFRSIKLITRKNFQQKEYNASNYVFEIEASCDVAMQDSKMWMNERPNRYCVLHGTNPIPKFLWHRVCYLTPLREPLCWFMPLDLPKSNTVAASAAAVAFHRNNATSPVATHQDAEEKPIQICIPSARLALNSSERVWDSLEALMPTTRAVRLVAFGRNASIPIQYQTYEENQQSPQKQVLAIKARSNLRLYLSYHQFLEQECHIHIPLLEPHGISIMYFPIGSQLKWSGSLADIQGHGIPSVLHQAVADLYGPTWSTNVPYAVYNDGDDDEHWNITDPVIRREEMTMTQALTTALSWYGVSTRATAAVQTTAVAG